MLTSSAFAAAGDRKMVNGAGTLQDDTWAFSLDLGGAYPEPVIYGVRFDRGIGERFQLGVTGTSLIVLNTLAINALFNVLKTDNDSDFFSLYLTPSVVHATEFGFEEEETIENVFVFTVQPGIAYEHRFGQERNTGLFAKLGSFYVLGAGAEGGFELVPISTNTTIITFGGGIQHNFGGKFSLSGEAGGGVLFGKVSQVIDFMLFKVGLTWAF